jgi:hypothetical protein
MLCGIIVNKKFTDKQCLIDCFWAIYDHREYAITIHSIINSGAILAIIDNIEGNNVQLFIPCIGILESISRTTLVYIDKELTEDILGKL